MLDGIYYAECVCHDAGHVTRFILDKKYDEILVEVQLNPYYPWYKRVWYAIKYVFGYQSRYGHWDCPSFNAEGAKQLRVMLDEFDKREQS